MQYEDIKLFNKLGTYFTVLLDKSQDVFWVVNTDYTVQIYVSPAFEKIWGYQPQVLFENPLFWLDTIVEEDRRQLASISRLPHSCVMGFYQERYRIVTASGEQKWILDHTYPILNHIGQCIGYAGIAQDITHTLALETDLQIANKFLPKLAEKMERSAFWVRDPSLKKQLYLSKGFEKIWGRSIKYLYDHPERWIETVVPEDRQRDVDSMLHLLDDQGTHAQYADLYRIQRPSGEVRWIRDISFPIFDDETKICIGFAGIAEDITQEKLYELELQQAKDKAETANVAKSNFIAGMSHDFRTPLNGLLGMAEILRSGRCHPEQVEYIEGIMQAGNTLLDLVEDIINYVALDMNKLPVNLEWFNLEVLLEEIVLTLSPQAHQKKVEMLFNYSEQVPKEIYGDMNRVRRILMNLVNNAVKFTNHGHVLINVEVSKQSKNRTWIQFIVEDTGIGISKDNFDYIFGSFNRVDPSYKGRYKGTGLGLTIVKQFLADLGGSIKLKSQINQGTVFYCTIPFQNVEKTITTHTPTHFSQVKTLIIDDFVRRAETFIKQFGLKNAIAMPSSLAIDALTQAQNSSVPFQMIILDDEIKEDFLSMAEEIRKQSDGYLVIIANNQTKAMIEQMEATGIDDYIMKPFQPLAVNQLLENAVLSLSTSFAERQNAISASPGNVLLVEDDLLTQKVTRWMLEELKWNVQIASTGNQALKMLENNFDLIIMDVGLPDMDGISLAGKIRNGESVNQKTPIVALTAHVMESDKEKCLASGMNDFLKKPLFKKDLKKLLLKLL